MKRLFLHILMALFLVACTAEENWDISPQQKEVQCNFTVTIPEPIAASRALEENVTISSLTLFVFNESGTLIAKNDAESTKKDGNNYGHTDGVYPYKVTLSSSNGNKRIIHFVANYTGASSTIGTEDDIMSALKVNNPQDTYWQRIELEGGIVDESSIPQVALVRNFAKIEVVKSSTQNNFGILGYDVVYEASQTNVTPHLRDAKGGFAPYFNIPENTDADPMAAYTHINNVYTGTRTNDVIDTAPELKDGIISNKSPIYVYERDHTANDLINPTSIIVSAIYNETNYFYKIELAKDGKLYNILRNFHYTVHVTNIVGVGETDLREAMTGNASNNISADIKVTAVSDGMYTLSVTPTVKTIVNVENPASFNIDYSLTRDPANSEDVMSVSFTGLEQGEIFSSITQPTTIGTSGTLTITPKYYSKGVDGGRIMQRFTVNTNKGLSREVLIMMIDKYRFINPQFTYDESTEEYILTYEIPANLDESLFPLVCIVKEEGTNHQFYPSPNSNMPVSFFDDSDGNGSFGYAKTITWDEYSNNGSNNEYAVTCNLKANTEITGSPKLFITNYYFYDGNATLQEATKITLDGTTLQNGTLTWYVGDEITDQTITVTLNNNVGYTLNELENFNVTKNTNGTLTITPKNALITSLEENLEISANDDTATATVKLQIIEKPVERTVYLIMKYYWDLGFLGNGTETITNGTISTSVSDNTITARFGTYNSTEKRWPLTITNASAETTATIKFSYKAGLSTYENTVKISDLLKLDNPVTEVTME